MITSWKSLSCRRQLKKAALIHSLKTCEVKILEQSLSSFGEAASQRMSHQKLRSVPVTGESFQSNIKGKSVQHEQFECAV